MLSAGNGRRVSAVGYYFARKVQQETHVPLGMVVDSVGGTPAEAWTSAEALRPLQDFDIPLAKVERLAATDAPQYGNFVMHWYDEYDIGIKGKWASPEFDDSTGKPSHFRRFRRTGSAGEPALVWFRKEIVLPDPLPAGGMMLPRHHRAHGYGLRQRERGRWQLLGGESARLFISPVRSSPGAISLPFALLRPSPMADSSASLKVASRPGRQEKHSDGR